MAYDPNNPPSWLSPTDMPSSGVGYSAAPTPAVPISMLADPPLPPHLQGRGLAGAPTPPVRPNLNVPVGQVAQSGSGSLWDALRALFSGQPAAQAQAQGMTGMLQSPRGQGARGTDALGNPFNRFG